MYKAIFLDIDDTVFNFKQCSKGALEKTFSEMELEFVENIYEVFNEIDEGLWAKQKRNELSVDEVLNVRFVQLKEKLGLDYDSDQFKINFGQSLGEQCIREPGIEELLERLSADYGIYAASNGVLSMQENRLQLAGLKKYFTDLFVSDDIGYAKPDINYFKECLNRSVLATSEVLMVGDSLDSDIAGANIAGIESCWYNPYGLENKSEVEADMEISHLNDLAGILKV